MQALTSLRNRITKYEEYVLSHRRLRIFFSLAIGALGGLYMGYNVGSVAPTLDALKDHFDVPQAYNSLIVGSLILGGLIGSLFAGQVSRWIGVKLTLALFVIVLGFGASFVTLFSQNYIWLFITRGLHGISIGTALMLCPNYTVELAPPELRGMLGSTFNIAMQTGTLFGYIMGFLFTLENVFEEEVSWRVVYGFSMVFNLIFIFAVIFMPESPRFRGKVVVDEYSFSINAPDELKDLSSMMERADLVSNMDSSNQQENGSENNSLEVNDDSGHMVNALVASSSSVNTPQDATNEGFLSHDGNDEEEASQLHHHQQQQQHHNHHVQHYENGVCGSLVASVKKDLDMIKRLCFHRQNLKTLLIGLILCVMQQCTGVNAILYYAPPLLEKAGLSGLLLRATSTIGVGFWNLITTLIPVLFVDCMGRRPLLLAPLFLLAVVNCIMGINFLFVPQSVQGYLAIAFIALFLLVFNLGIGNLFWVLVNEIWLDDQLKQVGPSILMAVMWGLSFFTGISFLLLLNTWIGSGFVFITFSIVTLVGAILLVFLLPETRVKKQDHKQTVAHTTFDA